MTVDQLLNVLYLMNSKVAAHVHDEIVRALAEDTLQQVIPAVRQYLIDHIIVSVHYPTEQQWEDHLDASYILSLFKSVDWS